MIHLAKFTDAPASRAAELIAQVAAAVHSRSGCPALLPDLARGNDPAP